MPPKARTQKRKADAIDAPSKDASSKKKRAAAAKPAPVAARPARTKQTARKSAPNLGSRFDGSRFGSSETDEDEDTDAGEDDRPTAARAPRTKQTARKCAPNLGSRYEQADETDEEDDGDRDEDDSQDEDGDEIDHDALPTAARPPRTKQTARKRAPNLGIRYSMPQEEDLDDDEDEDEDLDDEDEDEDDAQDKDENEAKGQSTLLNGTYYVKTSIDGEWAEYADDQSSITATSYKGEIWGSYDFGMFEGVFRAPEQRAGHAIRFRFRGIENGEGVISYDDRYQTGEMTFTSKGKVSGVFRGLYGAETKFKGSHDGAKQQRSGDAETYRGFKSLWDSYSEREYERARVGRWG